MTAQEIEVTVARSGNRIFCGATHQGCVRDHNEDAFGIRAAVGLALVSDGVGGLKRGEVASRAVVDALLNHDGKDVLSCVKSVHQQLVTEGSKQVRMGATVVAALFSENHVQLTWTGDSRAYLWRGGTLTQLTHDHSYVQKLLDMKVITPEEALTHPNRNVITSAIGIVGEEELEIEQTAFDWQPGDRLMMCSDGLYGYLPQAVIEETMRKTHHVEATTEILLARTLRETEAGDNVTVICVGEA